MTVTNASPSPAPRRGAGSRWRAISAANRAAPARGQPLLGPPRAPRASASRSLEDLGERVGRGAGISGREEAAAALVHDLGGAARGRRRHGHADASASATAIPNGSRSAVWRRRRAALGRVDLPGSPPGRRSRARARAAAARASRSPAASSGAPAMRSAISGGARRPRRPGRAASRRRSRPATGRVPTRLPGTGAEAVEVDAGQDHLDGAVEAQVVGDRARVHDDGVGAPQRAAQGGAARGRGKKS